ncbi:MAG TPA: M15 family metallopeptidase [Nitriliruptorales bacterium]
MKARASSLVAGLAGMVAGGLLMITVGAPAEELEPSERDADAEPLGIAPLRPAPARPPEDPVLLVWTAGALPDGLTHDVAELPLVTDVTVVAGGRLDLVASDTAGGAAVDRFEDGWGVALDALAIEPATYAGFVPAADRTTVAGLGSDRALLGATSARLRRLRAGDTVTLASGHTLTVAGVLDDVVVAGAEVVVARAVAEELSIGADRFLLVSHRGNRTELESAIRALASVEVRVRGPGETPFLRHGDAVLPQVQIKERFGEFSYRIPSAGEATFDQEPRWAHESLVTVDLPILGATHCHRDVVGQMSQALQELVDRGLAHLVDPEGFEGCYNPRLVTPGGLPSRHAWGVALDVNADVNPTGQAPGQDRRLVDTFARWGLTWGGFWLVPDPMHFEYLREPAADPAKVTPGPDAGTD